MFIVRLAALLVALMFSLVSAQAETKANEFMWDGLFIEHLTLRDTIGVNSGEVGGRLAYQIPLLKSGVKVNEGVALGYRWQLGESNTFVGLDGSYMPSQLTGGTAVYGPKGREIAAIKLTTGDTYSLGVHVGKETKPGRMVFVGMGMSQTDMSFETHGIRGLQSSDGSLDGKYVTIGTGRQLAGGWYQGFKVTYTQYDLDQPSGSTIDTRYEALSISATIGVQF